MIKRFLCVLLVGCLLVAIPFGVAGDSSPVITVLSAQYDQQGLTVTYYLADEIAQQEITCLVYEQTEDGKTGTLLYAVQSDDVSGGIHDMQMSFPFRENGVVVRIGGSQVAAWREVTVDPSYTSERWLITPHQTVADLREIMVDMTDVVITRQEQPLTDEVEVLPGDMVAATYQQQSVRWIAVVSGDADLNGLVSAQDALVILRSIVGKTTLSQSAKLAADIRQTGVVDAGDALMVLQYIVGKLSAL